VTEVRMAGWLVGVVEVGVHGCCMVAGATRMAWSTGWYCTENYYGFEWGRSSLTQTEQVSTKYTAQFLRRDMKA